MLYSWQIYDKGVTDWYGGKEISDLMEEKANKFKDNPDYYFDKTSSRWKKKKGSKKPSKSSKKKVAKPAKGDTIQGVKEESKPKKKGTSKMNKDKVQIFTTDDSDGTKERAHGQYQGLDFTVIRDFAKDEVKVAFRTKNEKPIDFIKFRDGSPMVGKSTEKIVETAYGSLRDQDKKKADVKADKEYLGKLREMLQRVEEKKARLDENSLQLLKRKVSQLEEECPK